MKEIPESISMRLKEVFDNSGINYVKIAKLLGIPRSTLYRYLDGYSMNSEAIIKVCKEFHVSADWLLFGDGLTYIEFED